MKREQNKAFQMQMSIKKVGAVNSMNHPKILEPLPLLLYP